VRVTFEWTSTRVDAGDYYVKITDNSSGGATSSDCYTIALSDSADDLFGWAKYQVAAAGAYTYSKIPEVYVWSSSSSSPYTASATNAMFLPVPVSDTAYRPSRVRDGIIVDDKHTIYYMANTDVFGDASETESWSAMIANTNSHTYLSTTYYPNLFMGRINARALYQERLVLGGIGGLALVDLYTLTDSDGTFKAAIPDIEGRISTTHTDWVNNSGKDADVYPPEIKAVCVAGINPGRIFAAHGDEIIWSGGTTSSTTGTPTSWSAFATIQFGDSTDNIEKIAYYRGFILIWTEKGHLYYISGEPPVDPSQGYGTLRADHIGRYGVCSHVCLGGNELWFATDDGRQLWVMDAGFSPKRVDDQVFPSIKINDIVWDDETQDLFVNSEEHRKYSYLSTSTNDSTRVDVNEEACTYMLSGQTGKWYRIQLPFATDETANQPTTFQSGRYVWRLGRYYSGSAYTYYAKVQSFSDRLIIRSTNSVPGNRYEPINSDYRAVTCTAELELAEVHYSELGDKFGQGAPDYLTIVGQFLSGSTATVQGLDQDDTATTLDTITGAVTAASRKNETYRIRCGAVDPQDSTRIKLSVTGENLDRVCSVMWGARFFPSGSTYA
jgi:hypothetical protein